MKGRGLPCLRKLLSGTCDNEKCAYGHKEDVMIKGALDMQTKINTYLEKHPPKTGTDGLKDYRILQRDSFLWAKIGTARPGYKRETAK